MRKLTQLESRPIVNSKSIQTWFKSTGVSCARFNYESVLVENFFYFLSTPEKRIWTKFSCSSVFRPCLCMRVRCLFLRPSFPTQEKTIISDLWWLFGVLVVEICCICKDSKISDCSTLRGLARPSKGKVSSPRVVNIFLFDFPPKKGSSVMFKWSFHTVRIYPVLYRRLRRERIWRQPQFFAESNATMETYAVDKTLYEIGANDLDWDSDLDPVSLV